MSVSKPSQNTSVPAGKEQSWRDYIHSTLSFDASHDLSAKRFRQLAAKWKNDTQFLSNTNEICTHSAYQQIIGMGPFALPHIFKEMRTEPGPWFWGLKAISRADPVPEA